MVLRGVGGYVGEMGTPSARRLLAAATVRPRVVRRRVASWCAALGSAATLIAGDARAAGPTPVPATRAAEQVTLAANGRVVVRASKDVRPEALRAAKERIDRVLSHAPRVAANLAREHVEVRIFTRSEGVASIPEFVHDKSTHVDGTDFEHRYWGGRAWGRLVACSEENLLALPLDPYPKNYDVCTHELAHVVLTLGVDSATQRLVARQYRASLLEGSWAPA